MIFIDLVRLEQRVELSWKERAAAALLDVRAATTSEDRKKVLTKHASLWAEVKHHLAGASTGKCWYCETRDVRSDAAVDHFRPKGKVEESPEHEGYWWLAFDFRNYRYCCTFCNSTRVDRVGGSRGGKQTHFPLLNPEDRVFGEGDIAVERPMLLDPIRATDPTLLYFREDGVPEPRYPGEKGLRASKSIEVYHLNHTELVEARLETLNRVRELISLGRRYYNSWLLDGSDEPAFESVIAQLKKLCAPEAEYSAAARDLVKGYRDSEHTWIDQVF
ncbi:hypothetical protein [Micromonospora humida]|uniref:hypothetical protein n=1 Tax=Micromonospora humida TaxID=2809018 RepID=UPI003401142E